MELVADKEDERKRNYWININILIEVRRDLFS